MSQDKVKQTKENLLISLMSQAFHPPVILLWLKDFPSYRYSLSASDNKHESAAVNAWVSGVCITTF